MSVGVFKTSLRMTYDANTDKGTEAYLNAPLTGAYKDRFCGPKIIPQTSYEMMFHIRWKE